MHALDGGCRLEEVLHQGPEPPGVAFRGFQATPCSGLEFLGTAEDEVQVAQDRGQGGSELVGDVGYQFVLGRKGIHNISDVPEDDDRSGEPVVDVIFHAPCGGGDSPLSGTGPYPDEVVGKCFAVNCPSNRALFRRKRSLPVLAENQPLFVRVPAAVRPVLPSA